MNSMRKYGVSAISLLPLSFLGMGITIFIAKILGFDGIQAGPLRGWRVNSKYDSSVISYEDAWNYGTFWEALKNIFKEDYNKPTILDLVIFRSKKYPGAINALNCIHTVPKILGPNEVVEIQPELSLDRNFYLELIGKYVFLCFDTCHAQRPHRVSGKRMLPWMERDSRVFAPYIQLIHVHPTLKELIPFLRDSESELRSMLIWLNKFRPNVDVIVEVFPGLLLIPGVSKRLLFVTKKYLK